MSHDLIAELAGYQAELAGAEQQGKKDRAAAVRKEIDRVIGAAAARIAQLLARAENHETAGEDLSAAQARVEAKALARALPEEKLAKHLRALAKPPGGTETAVQSTPQQTATPADGDQASAGRGA